MVKKNRMYTNVFGRTWICEVKFSEVTLRMGNSTAHRHQTHHSTQTRQETRVDREHDQLVNHCLRALVACARCIEQDGQRDGDANVGDERHYVHGSRDPEDVRKVRECLQGESEK